MKHGIEFKGLVLGTALAVLSAAGAFANIVYTVNQTIGAGSVTGTVTTDGAIGTLSSSDFLAWSLKLNGLGASTTITNLDSAAAVDVNGNVVTATPTDIYFNFGGPADNFILFQDHLFSGQTYWCNDTTLGTCFQGKSVVPILFSDPSTQVAAASGSQIIASVSSAIPEPSTWALLLIGFGALACGAYRRSGGRRAVA